MKKILIAFICLTTLTLTACTSANKSGSTGSVISEKTTSKNLEYTLLEDDTYEVSLGQCTDTDIIIPETYEDKTVTSIKDAAFKDNTNIKTVTMGDSIDYIGLEAFSGCKNLTSITLSNNITTIETCTFNECDNLESITIPESVTTIKKSAFMNCTKLKEVVIPDKVKKLGENLFKGCTSLENVTIGSNVSLISKGAFSSCESLTGITFENPDQWYAVSQNSDDIEYTKINEDLSDQSVAAKAFTETYSSSNVMRKTKG